MSEDARVCERCGQEIERRVNAKLNAGRVEYIRTMFALGMLDVERLSVMFGLHPKTVLEVARGRRGDSFLEEGV